MDEFDTIPVRLPSRTKAIVILPRPFTAADAEHLTRFLALYVEEAAEQPESPVGAADNSKESKQ